MGFAREPAVTQQLSCVSHSCDYLLNLQLLFTHLHFFDSWADCCHVIRTSGWQKSSNVSFFAEADLTLYTCVTVLIDSVAAVFAGKPARAFSWRSGSVLLLWASILTKEISEGKRIALRRSFTCCYFKIVVPEDIIQHFKIITRIMSDNIVIKLRFSCSSLKSQYSRGKCW